MRRILLSVFGMISLICLFAIFNEPFFNLLCVYYCYDLLGTVSIILGVALVSLVKIIRLEKTYSFFMWLLIADVLSYLLLPDYTDYVVPEKKISLLFFNILIPFVFLVYSLVKKNKGISIGKSN